MTDSDTTQPNKPATKPKPAQLDTGEGIRVKTLYFRESVDLPTEQQVRRISTLPREAKPRYQIVWLPRAQVYYVRAFDAFNEKPTTMFTIPQDWAIAEHEVAS
jgi:hypothetical protein